MRGSLDELQTFLKQGVDANTTDEARNLRGWAVVDAPSV